LSSDDRSHLLEHGLYHHVGLADVVITQRGFEQGHALFVFCDNFFLS
jgi:hypothetical protein